MTKTIAKPPVRTAEAARTGDGKRVGFAYLLMSPYLLLFAAFGVFPLIYAIFLSFLNSEGQFAGLDNFVAAASDFRYGQSLMNVGFYSVLFVVPSLTISVVLALVLQARAARTASVFRVLYYFPQALSGAASIIVWLFMLNPAVSPVGALLRATGAENIYQVVRPENLAIILAIIAVWTTANGVLMMHAALSSIPDEVVDAARVDGVKWWQMVWYIKLPMIRKWIAYSAILNVAGGSQLVVEPQLMKAATSGAVANDWSPLQIAFDFAYTNNDFGMSAALSVQLMLIAAVFAVIIVRKVNMFRIDV